MDKMRQPLLFATGSFFAVMLAIFGVMDLTGQSSKQGGTLPTASSSSTTCYRLGAPIWDNSLITLFSIDAKPIELTYPVKFTELIPELDQLGYILSYQAVKSKSQPTNTALYLHDVAEGDYTIKRKNGDGTAGTASFKQIDCEQID